MNRILCSTGALLGRPNKRDYRLLKEFTPRLNADGLELLVYDTWYPEIDDFIGTVKAMHLNIPVVHCEKAMGEALAGMKVEYIDGEYRRRYFDADEDREVLAKGLKEFDTNLRIANELGADKMVFHLWNGITSDGAIDKNIERLGLLLGKTEKAGVRLMIENVVCNQNAPLSNLAKVQACYKDIDFVYDTKMAEFHKETMNLFTPEYDWIVKNGHIKHLHVNDYDGGYMDWGNLNVLPIGRGHVDFDTFFTEFNKYPYAGDYTVEATGFDFSGNVNIEMLNECFNSLRKVAGIK